MVERRTAAKLIRFRPDELSRITESARRAGLTPARFIRETALGAIPKARPAATTGPLLRALAQIGRRLDHLTQHARATQDATLAHEAHAALAQHAALVRHVVQSQRRQKGGSPP